MDSDSFSLRHVRHSLVGISLISLLVAGCGAETYEHRLEETRKYFAFLQDVDQTLAPTAWNGDGIEFRAPSQFQLVSAPAPATDPQGRPRPIPPRSDPRQPRFLQIELPGLVAAWHARLPVDTGNGNQDRPAYLYICGNYSLWLQKETDPDVDPLKFFEDFGSAIASAVHASPPSSGYDWDWKRETIPMGTPYVPVKRFDSIVFEVPIRGVAHDVMLYRHQAGDIRVAIVYVIPQGVDPRQRIDKAIDYSLQYLNVSDQIPSFQPAAQPGAPGF